MEAWIFIPSLRAESAKKEGSPVRRVSDVINAFVSHKTSNMTRLSPTGKTLARCHPGAYTVEALRRSKRASSSLLPNKPSRNEGEL